MNMLFGFLTLQAALTIAHVFGAILGAGGAFASDSIFFSTMKDGRISKDEMRFLKLGSRLVWTGLFLLIASGAFLVGLNLERYMSSGKFLAKMTVVAIILVNGVTFHLLHLPRMEKNIDKNLSTSKEFVSNSRLLVASGAMSVVSWVTVVTLGVLSRVPYSYAEIMSVYIVLALLAIGGALFLRKRVLHIKR